MVDIAAPRLDIPPGPDFQHSREADPHRQRRAAILRAHPAVRRLYGANPWSAPLVVALAAGQLTIAWVVAQAPLWVLPVAAFCIGAFFAASLNALIHEASHNLIFRQRSANHTIALVANLPLVTWSAMPFFRYHSWHHYAVGDYAMDVGIPTKWEAGWVGNRWWRKLVWLAAFPLFQWVRTHKFRVKTPTWHGWMIANAVTQTLADIAILSVAGPKAAGYLLLSYAFAVGLHPLGTRVIQEHFRVHGKDETNNYVGWLSLLECNFGYHIEHHDFPTVPWNRLPRLSAMAPDFYRSAPVFRSRLALLINFIRNPDWHLYRHTVRETTG